MFGLAYAGFAAATTSVLALIPWFIAAGVAISCVETAEHAAAAFLAPVELRGSVRSVTLGAVMGEVVVDVNGQGIVSAITRGSAERLGLSEGSAVSVVIKSTDVLLATDHT